MNNSFNILNYTEARNQAEWELVNQNKKISIPIFNPTIKSYFKGCLPVVLCMAIGFIFILRNFWLALFFIGILLYFFLFVGALIYGSLDLKSEQLPKNFQDFGEKFIFLGDSIQINASIKSNTLRLLYTDLQNLTFCFKELEGSYDIIILKWAISAKNYQYTLNVSSDYEKKKIIEVLKHLYELKIPIIEMDEYGKQTRLLNMKENKANIPEKYLRLIDEIGGKEE